MTMMGVGLGVTPPFFTVILFLQTNPLIEHHPEAFTPSLSSRGLRGTLYCQLGIQGVLYRANDLELIDLNTRSLGGLGMTMMGG